MLIGPCDNCGRMNCLPYDKICSTCYKKRNEVESIQHKRDLRINKILKSKKMFWQFWKK